LPAGNGPKTIIDADAAPGDDSIAAWLVDG
jgi:hypothetical protein